MNHIFEKSAVEQEYIKLLQQEEIRIVSFDIFDTLVFRKVAQPQEIFKRLVNINLSNNFLTLQRIFSIIEFKLSRTQENQLSTMKMLQ